MTDKTKTGKAVKAVIGYPLIQYSGLRVLADNKRYLPQPADKPTIRQGVTLINPIRRPVGFKLVLKVGQ